MISNKSGNSIGVGMDIRIGSASQFAIANTTTNVKTNMTMIVTLIANVA